MNDEVRAMISEALRDEPPVGVDYDAVLAAGRRRRTRRQLGIVGGAVLGVAVVVSSAVVVGRLSASPKLTPAGPTTSTSTVTPAPTAAGCVIPAFTGGFSDAPAGTASQEELAESARLTEAFGRFPFPLPSGVTMDPAKPQLCVIKGSWGTQFDLHAPAADRTVFLEVRPRAAQPPNDCSRLSARDKCSLIPLPDGTSVLITRTSVGASDPVLVNVTAWRPDDTLVHILETGSGGVNSRQPILDDDALIKIVSAPQLKIDWVGPARPADASHRRAADLTFSMTKTPVLPAGLRPQRVIQERLDALAFYVSQGGYKLITDLVDAKGTGSLFINLSAPDADASVDCRGQAGCEQITLPDRRKATLTHQTDGSVQRIMLETLAADGTHVSVMTSNQSEKSASQGRTAATRPTPSLSGDDLVRIAALPWLRWS